MTQDELHKHLGTIAKSGTKEFLEKMQKAKEGGEHNLIGQFGVGFYSAFMVAEKVEVVTKSALDPQAHKWTSDGKSGYEVDTAEKDGRGTIITLYFSEGNHELLETWKIRELIKKYSNYVAVPIMMQEETGEDKKLEWKQLNETKAIWKKSKSEITDEQYKDFYQSVSMDFNPPLGHVHNNVEGNVSYKSLLFIPEKTNMFSDMRDPSKDYGPKLYVQNVLILEHAKELLPVWLRFVSGVVETSDLPLNISREMLQSNTALETIKKSLIKKILGELKKLREEKPTEFVTFFENYGTILKEGIYYEHDLKEDIAEVCLWESMNEGKKISLDTYLSPDSTESGLNDQTIYYITGKTRSEVLASPYLAQFQEAKVDVLFLTDVIDEWLVGVLDAYKGAKLKSITASDIELTQKSEEEKKQEAETQKEFKDLLELQKNTIGTEILEKVELNPKLGKALAALKTADGAMNPQMEKMMRAMGQVVPKTKRILELNPQNTLVQAMQTEFKKDVKSEKLQDMMRYAYMQAILLEGGELENMAEFVELTNRFAGKYMD